MNPEEVEDFYSRYALQFSDTIASSDMYHKSYDTFLAGAPRKSTLLDIACGPGNVSAYMRKLHPKLSITCLDISSEMLKIAKHKLENPYTHTEFFQSDMLHIKIPVKSYDLITCSFGIPYIADSKLEIFVLQIDRYATSGTAVYVSCMEGDSASEDIMGFANGEKLLAQRYKKEYVIEQFAKCNFLLMGFDMQDYTEPNGATTRDMFFYFEKR